LIIAYPVYESQNFKIQKESKKTLPPIVINDGDFFKYKEKLYEKGKFKKFVLNKDKTYTAYDVLLHNIEKNETIIGQKAVLKNEKIFGYNVKLITKEYNLTTTNGIYYTKTSEIEGGKFKIKSPEYRGFGESFFVDKNKNINATKVTYFIRTEK